MFLHNNNAHTAVYFCSLSHLFEHFATFAINMSDVPPALGTIDRMMMDLEDDGNSSFTRPIRESDLNTAVRQAMQDIQEEDHRRSVDVQSDDDGEDEVEVIQNEPRRGLFGRIGQFFRALGNQPPQQPRIIRTACAPINPRPFGPQPASGGTQTTSGGTMHVESPMTNEEMERQERRGLFGKMSKFFSGIVHRLHQLMHIRCRKETEVRAGFNRIVAETIPEVTRFLKRMDVFGPIRMFSPLPTGFYDTCYHHNGAIVYVGVDRRFVVCHKPAQVQDSEYDENMGGITSSDSPMIKRRELHIGHGNTIFGVLFGFFTHFHSPSKLFGLALRGLINGTAC